MRAHAGLAIACLGLLGAAPHRATAEQPGEDLIHWAYAAYFGMGRYSISGGEHVYMLSVKPRWQWREPALDDDGNRKIGIAFRFPAAIGIHDFDRRQPLAGERLVNVATVSLVPGVEFEIPVNERWSIKPLAYAGAGKRTSGGAWAEMFWVGIKSEIRFESGSTDWALVNSLVAVDFSQESVASSRILPLLTGLEFRRPLPRRKLGGEALYLHWHAAFTRYLDEIGFGSTSGGGTPLTIDDEWELGVGIGKAAPLELWRLKIDRISLNYRFSSDGEFSGIGLSFKSLFDR